jgi:hypothetical protein
VHVESASRVSQSSAFTLRCRIVYPSTMAGELYAPRTDDMTPKHGFASGLFGRRTRSLGSGGRGRCVADCTALPCGFGTIVYKRCVYPTGWQRDATASLGLVCAMGGRGACRCRCGPKVSSPLGNRRDGTSASSGHVCCGRRCLPTGRHAQPTVLRLRMTFFRFWPS